MIDIVVPIYNGEKEITKSVETIVEFLNRTAFPYPYRITLANNGSTDRSAEVCSQMARTYPEKVRSILIDAKGKGIALRTAWEKSDAEILSFMDLDLSSDLSFFRPLVELVTMNGADLAIGNRLGTTSQVVSHKALRKVASRFYNGMVRVFLRSPFDDHQCGFKVIRKDTFLSIAPHLNDEGFFFDTELIAIALHKGAVVKSLDITWIDSAESKVTLLKDSLKMFADILRLRKRLKSIPG